MSADLHSTPKWKDGPAPQLDNILNFAGCRLIPSLRQGWIFKLASKTAGVLQVTIWIRLAANSRGRRHTSEKEVIEPRDTVSNIQTGISVEVQSILATRRAAAEEQPVQQALRIGNVHPSIYITIVGNSIFINTKERYLVSSLAR